MTNASSNANPILALCNAIATQEGYFVPGTIPATRNNPGDLEYVGQLGMKFPPVGSPDMMIGVCDSPQRGIVKLLRDVCELVDMGYTVRQIVEDWAPASAGNNTAAYLANVLQWTGLPADTPVLELIPPLQKLN